MVGSDISNVNLSTYISSYVKVDNTIITCLYSVRTNAPTLMMPYVISASKGHDI